MTTTIVNSSTRHVAGCVTIPDGETFDIPGVVVTECSGFGSVTWLDGDSVVQSFQSAWIKGNDVPVSGLEVSLGGRATDPLNIGNSSGASVTAFYALTIINTGA